MRCFGMTRQAWLQLLQGTGLRGWPGAAAQRLHSGAAGRGGAARALLLELTDMLRVAMAGNLRGFRLQDRTGKTVKGANSGRKHPPCL